jgi:arachidonate 15-lipoxygenase
MLDPHLTYYLFDNELGRTTFVNPGGPVDRMMGGTLEESIGVAAEIYHKWSLFEAALPTELARRGVDDPSILPDYPFRDDGLLIWEALGKYVKNYIDIYYPDDTAVKTDPELQAWAFEIASTDEKEQGGKVKGMPSSIDSKLQLSEILRLVIWTMAPLHSMLNFSQWDYIYAPNMPYALYDEIPESGPVTDEHIMKILPPYSQAAFQLMWNKILTSYHYDEFASYKIPFEDETALRALKKFQDELTEIEKEIDRRQTSRPIKFPYFKPSRCINSINT